jgi:3'-5' exoribonuclease
MCIGVMLLTYSGRLARDRQGAVSGPPDLGRLPIGARVDDALLVLDVEQRESRHGRFTLLMLANRFGRLQTAPLWEPDAARMSGIYRGVVAQVSGVIGKYRGSRQLQVDGLRPLPAEAVDWARLQPSVGDVAPRWERLDRWRAAIHGPRLRCTLGLFFDEPEFRRRFEGCPASLAGHHAQIGGLLRHTAEVATIGRAIAHASAADADLVLAGALLHDIGKLDAYRWTGVFEMTELGSLLGHVTLGMLALDRRVAAASASPCTARELAVLQHLIASHHGSLELGAAVPPMTLEAEILHYADDASAKTASMADALAEASNFEPGSLVSAKPVWQLDRRRVYRGSSDWGVRDGGNYKGT